MLSAKFRLIMENHTERLIRVAYYYTKDMYVAEDIVQDVFIKFHEQIERLNQIKEIEAYLTRMVINKSKDYLKSWYVRKLEFQERWTEKATRNELDEFVKRDEETIVGEAILRLTVKYREVLVYYYFEEMTSLQIAELLQIPQSTVKTRLTRARQLLKQELVGVEWEVLLNE